MRIVTLASVRGAPGVTTTALMLASTIADSVVIEADLDGGVLAPRYGLGREPGLTTLAASDAEDEPGWRAHAQDAGGVPVLVGPDAPGAAVALWRSAGARISERLITGGGCAVVDAGRLRSPIPIVAASDVLTVLVCPVAEQLVALTHVLPTVREAIRCEVTVVFVGEGPYSAATVERALGTTVLGELPHDRDGAESLRYRTGWATHPGRSRLGRAVAGFGERLSTVVQRKEVGSSWARS